MATATNPDVVANAANEFQRAGLVAVDGDASALKPVLMGSAHGFRLGATCDRAAGILSIRIYYLDSNSRVVSQDAVQFAAAPQADWAGQFTGTPSGPSEGWFPLMGAQAVVFRVVSIAGVWNLAGVWG